MAERVINHQQGHERTLRFGPKPQGGWIKDAIVTFGETDTITYNVVDPTPDTEPEPEPTPTPTPVQLPPERTLSYVETPSAPLPAKGAAYKDPTFGTTIRRISDTGQRHGYSRRQPWSPDEKYLLLEKGGARLLDGATYQQIKTLSDVPAGPQWLNNNTLVGVNGNRLVTLNVETGDTGTIYTFGNYSAVTMGGEGRPSDDCRYFAMYGVRSGGYDLIVYDRSVNTYKFSALNAKPNWVGMSRTGKYAIVGYSTNNSTARGVGTELFSTTAQFIRQITQAYSHSDPGLDIDGRDVLAMCGQSKPPLFILDGGSRQLSSVDTAYGNSHVSAWGTAGWATYSTYKEYAGRPGSDQAASIKMDGSGKARVWGHMHHKLDPNLTRSEQYEREPQAVISPTGTRVLFASEWGTSGVYTFVASME
jgi:hypothetical protein